MLLTVLGFLGYHFGYQEFQRITQIRDQPVKDKEVIEQVRQKFEQADKKFRIKLPELSALDAMVLKIGRVGREGAQIVDEIDRYKNANINYRENRKEMLYYVTSYEDESNKPEVVVDALGKFLKLVEYQGDKINEKERSDVLGSILRTLPRTKEKMTKENNFRYRLQLLDNITNFSKILKKIYPEFYKVYFVPTLSNYFPILDDDGKFTLAEALVTLGNENKNYVSVLNSVIGTKRGYFGGDIAQPRRCCI